MEAKDNTNPTHYKEWFGSRILSLKPVLATLARTYNMMAKGSVLCVMHGPLCKKGWYGYAFKNIPIIFYCDKFWSHENDFSSIQQ